MHRAAIFVLLSPSHEIIVGRMAGIWKTFRETKKRFLKSVRRMLAVNPMRLHRAMDRAIDEMRARGIFHTPCMISKISPHDRMFKTDAAHYFRVGYSALHNIRAALGAVGKTEVRAILDMPCGHGRVLRAMRAAFPVARITACELETDGVDFCARTFGAIPVYSKINPAEIGMRERFDLIWVGSLFTHLDASRWPGFLAFFTDVLARGGVLIFTTHGSYSAECMRARTRTYSLQPEQIDAVLASCERDGFGYSDYRSGADYGTSLSTADRVKAFVAATPGLALISYTERAWDEHQDVVACVRR